MNAAHSRATVEKRRLNAKHLVSRLEAVELIVLAGLAMGMSRRAIADRIDVSFDEVERILTSMMNKLGARTIADAVRVAILANLTLPD